MKGGRTVNDQAGSRPGNISRSLASGTLVLLILGGTIILFFNRLAGLDLILARGDTYLYFYPYWQAAADAFHSGRIPLWNPNLFMGAPFVANSQVGFFYPLNWPLWLLFSTPYAMSISIIMHLLIAASGVYLVARRCLALSRPAAILGALLFSLGSYLTAQVEHINQIQGLAWLPWYFVVLSAWRPGTSSRRESIKVGASFTAVMSLQILSGHTQTVFISLVAVIIWQFATFFSTRGASVEGLARRRRMVAQAKRLLVFLAPIVIGTMLALSVTAVQVIPTLELSRYSIRQGGLPVNEVLSFSLQPQLLGQSLLPPYEKLIFSEYVLALPISGLLLAAIGAGRSRRTTRLWPFLVLAALGLILALGRFNPAYYLLARLPGFNLFRAPARWAVLYALAMALLAASGWQWLHSSLPGQEPESEKRRAVRALVAGTALVIILVAWNVVAGRLASHIPAAPETTIEGPPGMTLVAWIVELGLAMALILLAIRGRVPGALTWVLFVGLITILFLSTRILSYNHPTTARAYFEQRPPVSRMLAAQECHPLTRSCQADPGRILGLSDIFFDLGDQPELDGVYGPQLGEGELFDYVVATKQKEILSPNLPLLYGLRSVDGFDGGILPLESYALLMSLVLPEGEQTLDGRLREHLDTIPEERWLDHFGARYIITDKVGDQWRQGIFFDMKHPITLAADSEAVPVGYLPAFEATDIYLVGEGSPGTLALVEQRGEQWQLTLERLESDLWRVRLPHPATLTSLTLTPCQTDAEPGQCDDGWTIESLALLDARDGTFVPLVPGGYRLVFSGDVKIYENLDVSPLASLLFDWRFVPDFQNAIAVMKTDDFEPGNRAILQGTGPAASNRGHGHVVVEEYAPERITLRSESDSRAALIVREAFYPGWQATIDGEAADVMRADVLFRSVFVSPGNHLIELTYRPVSYQIGLVLTMIGLTVWLVLVACALLPAFVRRPDQRTLPVSGSKN